MNKMEKVYKTMENAGIVGIVTGCVMIIVGVTSGVLTIIYGAQLLKNKGRITF